MAGNIQHKVSDILASGYIRAGSHTPPANFVNGDMTVTRLMVGEDVAFGTATDAVGYIMSVRGTMTNTAAGAASFSRYHQSIVPASNSSAEFRSLFYLAAMESPTGVTLNIVRSAFFDVRNRQDGAIAETAALVMNSLVMDSSSPAVVGTVTLAKGVQIEGPGRPSGTSTGTVTEFNGLNFRSARYNTAWTIGTSKEIYISNPTGMTATIHYAIDIEKLTRATTNVEFRNGGKMVYTPTAQTLSAAGNTIGTTARHQDIDNSTGALLTLTSTPTLTAGVADGQMVTITNVDTADSVVIQDESVLAGSAARNPSAANLTLGPRDSVTYRWKASTSEWWAQASANL